MEEVHVIRSNAYEAAHVPLSEAITNRPLSHRGAPRSSHRRGVAGEVRGTDVIGIASDDGLEGTDERFDALLLRCGQGLANHAGEGTTRVDGVRVLADDHERVRAAGRVFADPEAEPPAPGDTDEVRSLDIQLVENRYHVRDAKGIA